MELNGPYGLPYEQTVPAFASYNLVIVLPSRVMLNMAQARSVFVLFFSDCKSMKYMQFSYILLST